MHLIEDAVHAFDDGFVGFRRGHVQTRIEQDLIGIVGPARPQYVEIGLQCLGSAGDYNNVIKTINRLRDRSAFMGDPILTEMAIEQANQGRLAEAYETVSKIDTDYNVPRALSKVAIAINDNRLAAYYEWLEEVVRWRRQPQIDDVDSFLAEVQEQDLDVSTSRLVMATLALTGNRLAMQEREQKWVLANTQ